MHMLLLLTLKYFEWRQLNCLMFVFNMRINGSRLLGLSINICHWHKQVIHIRYHSQDGQTQIFRHVLQLMSLHNHFLGSLQMKMSVILKDLTERTRRSCHIKIIIKSVCFQRNIWFKSSIFNNWVVGLGVGNEKIQFWDK